MKELTKEEIEKVFEFYKIRNLRYYDLQIEVVDHFASTIEVNWETYPSEWSFEQKIASVYDDLGFKGFRSMMRGKSKMVFRNAYKSAFEYVKRAIKIPQIFLTIALIYFLQQTFILTEWPRQVFKFMFLIPQSFLMFVGICILIGYYLSFKKNIYVIEQSFSYLTLWTLVPNLSFSYFNFWPNFPCSPKMYILISTLLILFTILCMASLLVIWKIFTKSKNRYEHLSNV